MILAFGCSVTHGAELVSPHQDEANTKFSYPNLIADALGVECHNYAECGISNEGIFHKTINILGHHIPEEVTYVIVGWTSAVREYWVADGRQWFFIPSWCATKRVDSKFKHFKDYVNNDINNNPRICADEEMYLEPLAEMYEQIMKHKFDIQEYSVKAYNYIEGIRAYCQKHNFKLIETGCLSDYPHIKFNLNNFGTWRNGLGHPTKQDHEQIAQQILLSL